MAWRTRGRDRQAYSFTYDHLSRLSTSTYYDINNSGTATATNRYNENLTYDLRGNISTLQRQGYLAATCGYGQIDNLSYTYDVANNPNRIVSIADNAPANQKVHGFNPGAGGAGYAYDANGNLRSDSYKGISNITYNHLNLPGVISYTNGNSIEFIYDAAGMKLRKIVKVGATIQYEQDYAGGLEYRKVGTGSKRVEAVYHAEGRYYNLNVEVSNTVNWRKEYTIKDHLGNTRITFTDKNGNGIVDVTNSAGTNDIIQENHYYPFGLSYEGPWLMNDVARDNKYQYNGKELNEDFGLNWNDYGARWYDAAIGRWNAVDPMAEKYFGYSPYNYTLGNPLKFIDPNGMDVIVGNQAWTPGAKWKGSEEDFGHKVFTALNSLYDNIKESGAGNVSTKEKTGNVILDFVGENAIGDVTITQAAEGQGSFTQEDGTLIIWDSEQGIHVGPTKDGKNVEGDISATTLLAHEFGHAWLAQASPKLNAAFERVDANAKSEMQESEEKWNLKNVENTFSKARGEGVRSVYRSIYSSKNDMINTIDKFKNSTNVIYYGDYFIKKR